MACWTLKVMNTGHVSLLIKRVSTCNTNSGNFIEISFCPVSSKCPMWNKNKHNTITFYNRLITLTRNNNFLFKSLRS